MKNLFLGRWAVADASAVAAAVAHKYDVEVTLAATPDSRTMVATLDADYGSILADRVREWAHGWLAGRQWEAARRQR